MMRSGSFGFGFLLAAVIWPLLGCTKPIPLTELPVISIPIERKSPPGDAPPPPKALEPEPLPAVHQQPDPAPVRTAEQVELLLRFQKGHLHLVQSQQVTLKAAESTPRRMGRFAAELWLGTELIERLRFEVPLLGTENDHDLEQGLTTEVRIRLPFIERANRLEIVDRQTEERLTLVWPLGSEAKAEAAASPEAAKDEAAVSSDAATE